MKRLTINLATRARPESCIETLERTLGNIALPETTLMVSLDRDDHASVQQLSAFALDHPRIVLSIKSREDSLGEKFNRALEHPADAYMVMVDYAPHITPAFDKKILEAASVFPDGIGVVYNYMANATFPALNVVTHKLAEKMGFIYPPWFPFWFVDHWLLDIGKMIGRISWAYDVKVDVRPRPGTQDCRDLAFWTILYDSLHLRRRKCAEDIINGNDFLEPVWRKRLLLQEGHFRAIDYYSKWVNDGMRADPKGYEAAGSKGLPDEERYVRVKSRALELMGELIPELQDEQDRLAAE